MIDKNRMRRQRNIRANEDVEIAPEATDLLFEAEDVAELVAEVTGDVVEVTADGDTVVFAIGEGEDATEFTVTAEGDEEVLESCRRVFDRKRPVSASRRPAPRRSVAASQEAPVKGRRTARTIRKVPTSKK